MADTNLQNNNMFQNDPFDINELATLNEDISPEFIEQLQNQVAQNLSAINNIPNMNDDDSTLFEEVVPQEESEATTTEPEPIPEPEPILPTPPPAIEPEPTEPNIPAEQTQTEESANSDDSENKIASLTNGNITEKPITQEQLDYSESLDFVDGNVKYSKYVIYIDPHNAEFMEGLTVKERKNLINRIIKEQSDIAMTKYKYSRIQTVIRHLIVAIITILLSIPVIYYAVNASLEASINNYRRSQGLFQVLYKEHGKINSVKQR